jgi:hypothetical protein
MDRIRRAVFTILLGLCTAGDIASADEAETAWTALRAGRHVALMRHTDAPGGVGDPRDSGSMTAPLSAISVPRDAQMLQGSGHGSGRNGLRSKESSARRDAAAWTRQRCWSWDRSRPSRHSAMWSC